MTTNEAPATHRAINLAGVTWIEDGRRAGFAAARPGYGVEVIATGEVLSKGGVSPSTWSTKSAADIVAQYPMDWPTVAITRR